MTEPTSASASDQSVSVVIAVRNGETFIGDALKSVFAQTTRVREVIVVDDGSDDATVDVVKTFPDAICVPRPPLGFVPARNHGIEMATSTHIAFLDADDLWMPTKTELQLAFLAAHPDVDIVSGMMMNFRMSDTGEIIPRSKHLTSNLPGLLLMRRETFWRVGLYSGEMKFTENLDWWSRAQDLKLSNDSIPSLVLMRRFHSSNTSRSVDNPMQVYLRGLHAIVKRRREQQ